MTNKRYLEPLFYPQICSLISLNISDCYFLNVVFRTVAPQPPSASYRCCANRGHSISHLTGYAAYTLLV